MTLSPSPRLTRLELHGFKSFAARTVFAFDGGITAIIGPNGSGKSNVADGIRWVLGEQSTNALRSRKTEDVIFAGGHGRAPSGMAEVILTFDNSTGWLPIEFAEVTVTRRAYRGGENQYLVNGRKVRLKDVQHLTASLGQSHVVVGQGLVDAALSLRAEERRTLFEHAADLTGLRLKAAEAERNLNETESNSARLHDLLTELEPRLRTLERAARQAREWQGVHERLVSLQRFHYGRQLTAANQRFADAERAARGETAAVEATATEVERLAADVVTARERLADARAALDAHGARLQGATDDARRVSHERDLARERHASLTRRRDDMSDTRTGLDDQAEGVERDISLLAAELSNLDVAVTTIRTALTARQTEVSRLRGERQAAEQAAARLGQAIAEAERNVADVARQRALAEQRRETDSAERDRLTGGQRQRSERLARLEAELREQNAAEQADSAALATLDARTADLAKAAERARVDHQAARTALTSAERAVGETATRLEALQKVHDSGAGLHAGVRTVVLAAKDGRLQGVRGVVAELIVVPARFDTALEVALGGHLQDVIVGRWADAEAAIALLKRSNAGRATFQPIETVRQPEANRSRTVPREAMAMAGVHGMAASLIGFDDDIEPIMQALLGRTVIVEDLPAARAALPKLPGGWSAVTLAGELARTGGSVTGGAAVRESGMLGRERELRDLPGELAKREQARERAAAAYEAAANEPRAIATEQQQIDADRSGLLAGRKERTAQRARLTGWIEELQSEQAAGEKRLGSLDAAGSTAGEALAALAANEAAAAAQAAQHRVEREAITGQLATGTDSVRLAEQAVADEQQRLATIDERLRSERRRDAALTAQRAALADELATRADRAAMLEGELTAVTATLERTQVEVAAMESARDRIAQQRGPLAQAMTVAESDLVRSERSLEGGRSSLMATERALSTRDLEVERARNEHDTIVQRILDDLELDDPNELLNDPAPADTTLLLDPPEAEREIGRMKERLRRVGYVGEDVLTEYEREFARHDFLKTQLQDVEGAAVSLRTLLNDLQATMRTRFEETFERVAVAFTDCFTTLFGGGTARLVLTPSDDGNGAAIDIVAQPPGKRLQSLALLSGGERSLTAVALLFAILRVNPTPFCLLDEVDAALDEANVVRFREELQKLAAETQSIVITHNRSTIEIADTLYGVSMRADGVSQVLSLRLSEALVGED